MHFVGGGGKNDEISQQWQKFFFISNGSQAVDFVKHAQRRVLSYKCVILSYKSQHNGCDFPFWGFVALFS